MSQDKDTAQSQAVAQVDSICRMVAALECDFDRLEELREERDNYSTDQDGMEFAGEAEWHALWAQENPSDADELTELEEAAGEWSDRDDVAEAIQQDALEVSVRSAWQSVAETLTPDEFRIVLCTGGPHVELVGDLDHHLEPYRVRVLYRGWGESGELFSFDHDAVLTYCREFYFGA